MAIIEKKEKVMRKRTMSLTEAKDNIQKLKGKMIQIKVNKGRKRVVKYLGEVIDVYPSVFTLKINGEAPTDKISCSYSDVICGDIVLSE